ncbi:1-(5-phosphoribosyl)-5-[(5-phosphoribosylamino)methylideneamino]imidazole-4-carboxamide isomerase [Thermoflavifilum thermophilum]|uniref:1-(5-phosphoribosyl)-5-[(5-phosphoribosylamino)methylideneamino] imidazole-4-carboxamide isomerase n=1 Tax=Thermoflavifilum thermophilum TaxID=1393122 RepID=A0A1I7NH11_9BACT|nr:1-(5-phosphoribosyl)-5-[(5-phosphoribosylamino)methylideneamino]imidazole-4-carboxamide isomerase [Thermoflavifilum thermophilum]SFV33942.1 1-(5-phosphoribosyl)-5-[(5-phosphoribosylamino)methylideneamino] imidazole-4-carboxamide isomerase [Thermoflavifilum thermophilum]
MPIELIPAIDIINGQCVRLTRGDYQQQKVYSPDPLEVARLFEASGLRRLHLVDLDGARERKVKNWEVLERIARHTSLVIDFGGGITTAEEVKRALQSGASLVVVGSMAAREPDLFRQWLDMFGADKFLLGADVKNNHIAIHGWQQTISKPVVEFLQQQLQMGVKQVFCTDVERDGMLQGPAFELYSQILKALPDIHLIASGGVQSMEDIKRLEQIGLKGVIVGKAIYEGKISLEEWKKQKQPEQGIS